MGVSAGRPSTHMEKKPTECYSEFSKGVIIGPTSLADTIQHKEKGKREKVENRYLAPVAETGEKEPIFIVPSAGATFFSFLALGKALKANRPLYSFSLTELKVTDSENSTIQEIASTLLKELRDCQPKGPYFLGGHCWGGVVAFEMASQLEADGQTVGGLFLFESFVPIIQGSISNYKTGQMDEFQEDMTRIVEETLDEARAKLAKLPKVHIDRLVALTDNQMKTSNTYETSPIQAPIHLFKTDLHTDLVFEGWEALTHSSFAKHRASGETHTMLNEPHVQEICRTLEALLI